MVDLPPGILLVIQSVPSLVLPPATVVAANLIAADHFGYDSLPPWAAALAALLSLPVAFTVRLQYTRAKNARDARKHGAVLPPRVKDSLPLGIGILRKTLDNFNNGYAGDLFNEWHQEYGTIINFEVLGENRFLTTEPDYIKAVLATQFESFEKGPVFQRVMRTILGTGVFNSDGEMWKFHRGMTRPFFTKDRIAHFDIFDRHAADAIRQLKERLREGYPVDIQDLASRFTMDSATEFLFAKDVQSLAAGLPYPHYSPLADSATAHAHPANKFTRAFDEAQRLTALRGRKGIYWPLAEFWRDQVKGQMKVIYDFVNPILEAALQRKKDSNGGGKLGDMKGVDREVDEDESLLDHLVNYTDDQTMLRDETLNILLAGRDTTTNSITWAIYMLSQHPNVLERLREEILETVGPDRRPDFDDMKNMKYLRAVINETLRLYPAVPFNIRSSNQPVVLRSKQGGTPIYIPAGTKTGYSVFLMHRRPDLWGPDADVFDPDRFLDAARVKAHITPNPFIFLPFNAGPRICLGQQFAYHETSFFLVRLLQQFARIEHVKEAQPPISRPPTEWRGAPGTKGRDGVRIKTYLTMSIFGGLWVNLEEAAQGDVV